MKIFKRLASAALSAAMVIACLGTAPLSAGAADITGKAPDIIIGFADDLTQLGMPLVKSIEEIECTNVESIAAYCEAHSGDATFSGDGYAIINAGEDKITDEIKQNGIGVNFKFDAPSDGKYILSPWTTDPTDRGVNFGFYTWHLFVDGVEYNPVASKTEYSISGLTLVKGFTDSITLAAGEHTVTVKYDYDPRNNRVLSYFDCIRVYQENGSFINYDGFTSDGAMVKDGDNRHWSVPAAQFTAPYAGVDEQRQFSYTVSSADDGIYAIDYIAKRNDGVVSNSFGKYSITVNDEKYSSDMLTGQKVRDISDAPDYLSEYKIYAKLNKGENKITFNLDLRSNPDEGYIFFLNSIAFYRLDNADENGNPYIEGEELINIEVLDGMSYNIENDGGFSGSKAIFVVTEDTTQRNIKYGVYAQAAGEYQMNFAAMVLYDETYAWGSDFDMTIGGNVYTMMGNTQSAYNQVSSARDVQWFQYVYNYPIHLDAGWNDVTITMKKRPEGNDLYFGLDKIEFTLLDEEEPNISVAGWSVDGANVRITLNNNTSEIPAVFIAVFDNDNQLTDVKIASGDGVNYTSDVPAVTEDSNVYIFVWNAETLKPYCGKYECDLSDL